jgi:hypothetical protein
MGDAVIVISRLEGFREVDRIKHDELELRTLRACRVRVTAFGRE